jgi:hypothetical protein
MERIAITACFLKQFFNSRYDLASSLSFTPLKYSHYSLSSRLHHAAPKNSQCRPSLVAKTAQIILVILVLVMGGPPVGQGMIFIVSLYFISIIKM